MHVASSFHLLWARRRSVNFSNFHTFVCKYGWVDKRLDAVRGKTLQTNVWKIKKN